MTVTLGSTYKASPSRTVTVRMRVPKILLAITKPATVARITKNTIIVLLLMATPHISLLSESASYFIKPGLP